MRCQGYFLKIPLGTRLTYLRISLLINHKSIVCRCGGGGGHHKCVGSQHFQVLINSKFYFHNYQFSNQCSSCRSFCQDKLYLFGIFYFYLFIWGKEWLESYLQIKMLLWFDPCNTHTKFLRRLILVILNGLYVFCFQNLLKWLIFTKKSLFREYLELIFTSLDRALVEAYLHMNFLQQY